MEDRTLILFGAIAQYLLNLLSHSLALPADVSCSSIQVSSSHTGLMPVPTHTFHAILDLVSLRAQVAAASSSNGNP